MTRGCFLTSPAVMLGALVLIHGAVGARASEETAGLLDRTMTRLEAMDFEFARAESELPFLPVLSLSLAAYGETTFYRGGDASTFRQETASGYAALPLYIGRRGMALAVPYVGTTRFDFPGRDLDATVSAAYLPAGVAWQTEAGYQWVVFGMPAFYTPMDDDAGDVTVSSMAGVIGRAFQGDRLVWYYGAVYDQNFSDGYVLPYLGLTYNPDAQWAISIIAPWPAVSYAVNRDFFLRAGVVPSGASWDVRGDPGGREAIMAFGGWNGGVWANARLHGPWWLSAGAGYSGLRGFEVSESGDLDWNIDVDPDPWVSVSVGMRPL